MVARLIHRHAASDRLHPGTVAATLADVGRGDVVLFGADASSALAIRDAAPAVERRMDAAGRCVDLGDLRDAAERLPALLWELERRAAKPVMLGGDAGLGSAFVDALAASGRGVILLSPRLDLRLPATGARPAVAIGTQRLVGKAGHDAWREAGGAVVPAARLEAEGAAWALSAFAAHADAALLLVDLSVIDTGYAAGAALRNVGGLSPMAVLDLVAAIIARFDIRGLALLNLAPDRDPRGHSERIAAMIAAQAIARAFTRLAA